ncbi:hypothetical protein SDC9_196601 [bioreactor metagenome]|uniref:Uncharacterized protein n=1 Tax=bioreactor metagenome TaxID=1076179 RepID=A0A645ICF7_9ZZZZ
MGATALVAALLAGRHPGALGEDDHADAVAQPVGALLGHLGQGVQAGLAVDGDHANGAEGPTQDGQLEQFLLEHEHHARKPLLQGHRLPGRLVLGQHHHGLVGDVVGAPHLGADAEHAAHQPLHEAEAPGVDQHVGRLGREGSGENHQEAEDGGERDGQQEEQGRAELGHGRSRQRAVRGGAASR